MVSLTTSPYYALCLVHWYLSCIRRLVLRHACVVARRRYAGKVPVPATWRYQPSHDQPASQPARSPVAKQERGRRDERKRERKRGRASEILTPLYCRFSRALWPRRPPAHTQTSSPHQNPLPPQFKKPKQQEIFQQTWR